MTRRWLVLVMSVIVPVMPAGQGSPMVEWPYVGGDQGPAP